jgi:hypothetical protein
MQFVTTIGCPVIYHKREISPWRACLLFRWLRKCMPCITKLYRHAVIKEVPFKWSRGGLLMWRYGAFIRWWPEYADTRVQLKISCDKREGIGANVFILSQVYCLDFAGFSGIIMGIDGRRLSSVWSLALLQPSLRASPTSRLGPTVH